MNNSLTLQLIEEMARTKAYEMGHTFVGVEHLFLTLLNLKGSIIYQLLNDLAIQDGITPPGIVGRLSDEISVMAGGNYEPMTYRHTTPRALTIFTRAEQLQERGGLSVEQCLLSAILADPDNIPIRAMQTIGITPELLLQRLRSWTGSRGASLPDLDILPGEEGDIQLDEGEQRILKIMFDGYRSISLEHDLRLGHTGARVLIVQPRRIDGGTDWRVIVKLGLRQSTHQEIERYERFVRSRLPPQHARVESTFDGDYYLGGIKYSFIQPEGQNVPIDFREFTRRYSPAEVSEFLSKKLFGSFREGWWDQAILTKFDAWVEFDLLLPPVITVEKLLGEADQSILVEARMGEQPTNYAHLQVGEIVRLHGFLLAETKPRRGAMTISTRYGLSAVDLAGRIEVQGIDESYFGQKWGTPVQPLLGRVLDTRRSVLDRQAENLIPNRDAVTLDATQDDSTQDSTTQDGDDVAAGDDVTRTTLGLLPNPLLAYEGMLQKVFTGMMSPIHGDFHAENILIGPNDDPWLIDFGLTRHGYTLLDWAMLEISLIVTYATRYPPHDDDALWQLLRLLDLINHEIRSDPQTPLEQVLTPIFEIRRIVSRIILSNLESMDMRSQQQIGRDLWAGYFAALFFCSLRSLKWQNTPQPVRRLCFLNAALALAKTNQLGNTEARTQSASDTTTAI